MEQKQFGIFNLLTWILYATLYTAAMLFLAGCGGGGGGGPSDNAPPLRQGIFVDSPVQGLSYQTPSRLGVTDSNGSFSYLEGELLTFLLGDLELGRAEGQAIITPVDLVAGASGANDPAVTNICRLLQTLDVDGNPANGIVLAEAASTAMNGRSINFGLTPESFDSDPEILGMLTFLNSQGAFPGGNRMLVSAEQASNHLLATLAQECGNNPNCSTGESSFESELRGLINSYRRQSGLGDLVFDPHLYQLAQEHSANMQAADVMSHDGFSGRFNRSGYRTCVENVAWNYSAPDSLLAGWQNSSGHNLNLLNANIDSVGVAKSGPYETFFACGN